MSNIGIDRRNALLIENISDLMAMQVSGKHSVD
jgi:hypothetical protein